MLTKSIEFKLEKIDKNEYKKEFEVKYKIPVEIFENLKNYYKSAKKVMDENRTY